MGTGVGVGGVMANLAGRVINNTSNTGSANGIQNANNEKMEVFGKIDSDSFEQIVYCNDPGVGLKAIISLHSTALGPATGGCRMWNYGSESDALTDVLRLSKGMTYKAAISNLSWGGGKAVILGDPKTQKSKAMLERFGEFVERLGGHYITAKDVGLGADDLRIIKSKTQYVLGIDGEPGSSGDPSPATALGVYHGMRACVKHALGTGSLQGLRIVMQGLGSVNYALLDKVLAEGAQVIACDIDPAMVQRATRKYGIDTVSPEGIYDISCDIFAPGALGAVINSKTLPRLKTKIIAGAANNQLASPNDGLEILRRKIVYAPDYVINAGGLINIYHEKTPGGYKRERAFEHVEGIGDTLTEILERAEAEKLPTNIVADRIAGERILKARVNP